MKMHELARAGDRPAWHPLWSSSKWHRSKAKGGGRLVFHYSPDFARFPCRDVMKLADGKSKKEARLADNKSDPNLETLTFGMWSTCDRQYRQTMAEGKGQFLFFRTNVGLSQESAITGFYDLGWYLDSWYVAAPGKARPPHVVKDRFLAAREAHFVAEPLPVADAAKMIGRRPAELKRRSVVSFSPKETDILVHELRQQPDATRDYITEIYRLERRNLSVAGVRYVNWNRIAGFDWEAASICMSLAARPPPSDDEVESWAFGVRRDEWMCRGCDNTMKTPRAIKLCSICDDGGYIVPILEEANS